MPTVMKTCPMCRGSGSYAHVEIGQPPRRCPTCKGERQIQTYEPHSVSATGPTPPRTPEEADRNFAGLLALLTAGVVGYADYASGQNLAWYGHVAFVGIPALAVGWFFTTFTKITRLLRLVTAAVLLAGLLYGGLHFTDVLPSGLRFF